MGWDEFPVILGQGTLHDLRDGDRDLRSPRLAGLKSVNYAGAVGLAKRPVSPQRHVGFFPRGVR